MHTLPFQETITLQNSLFKKSNKEISSKLEMSKGTL
jgi:hypothetical protein